MRPRQRLIDTSKLLEVSQKAEAYDLVHTPNLAQRIKDVLLEVYAPVDNSLDFAGSDQHLEDDICR